MTSDEERREVAAKLRCLYEHIDGVPPVCSRQVHNAMALSAIRAVVGKGDIFHLLAELIDVPAAKGTIEDDGTSVCGHCGFRFDVSVETAGCFSEVVLANHCPQCGRLLVWCDEVDE